MSNLKIGVVTVTYNSEKFLDDFFKSLDAQTNQNWFAYIIDNDSTDATVKNLKKLSLNPEKYKIILNEKNIGVAAANNQGIQSAIDNGCDYILLLNNDTVFESELFSKLLNECILKEKLMAAPKMMYHHPANKIWWGGGYFVNWKMHSGAHAAMDEIDLGQTANTEKFDYCPTCCLLVHRLVFQKIGLMDEKYFVYYDDTDFAFRAMRAGIDGAYMEKVDFYHKVSGSTGGGESNFSLYYMTRNRAYYVAKNLGRTKFFIYSVMAPTIYLGRFVFGLISKNKFQLLMKAHVAGIRMKSESV